ncbi:MAG TPA: hypothetical protein PKA32_02310 [Candidatus Gracilibacteria bacterium]|nr:hypothetical protein [Candidatus Gracilibacteria bacterium]
MAQDESTTILKEAIQRIKNLIEHEKWQEAHRACLEILRYDPENLQVIRLKNKIEKAVQKVNKRAINEDIQKLKPLWKEKNFQKLLDHLKELRPYRKQHKALDHFISKVDKAYAKAYAENQKEYFEAEMKNIQKLLEQKEYQKAILAAQKLRITKYHEKDVKRLILKIKNEWIAHEIADNKKLLESDKYEDALLKAQQIKKIDPESEKIKHLIKTTKDKYQRHKVVEQRDFIYKGLEKTRTLMQLKKFDKALQAASEILDVDPENKKAQYMFQVAKRKALKNDNRALRRQMKKSKKELKEEYKKDKSKFIKI